MNVEFYQKTSCEVYVQMVGRINFDHIAFCNQSTVQFNPLPALTYQNILDINVACRAKRTQTYWHVRKFKCPLKKTQPSCPCSSDLNWTGKGLNVCCTTVFFPSDKKDIHVMRQHGAVLLLEVKLYCSLIGCKAIECTEVNRT
jgi:hypothetical protein